MRVVNECNKANKQEKFTKKKKQQLKCKKGDLNELKVK